jgi:hypothetical protein
MILNGLDVVEIAVQGPDNSLVAYSQVGPGDFSPDTVVGSGTTFSAPAILQNDGVDIAIQGSGNALDIYWSPNGTGTWDGGNVAASGTTYSAPVPAIDVPLRECPHGRTRVPLRPRRRL